MDALNEGEKQVFDPAAAGWTLLRGDPFTEWAGPIWRRRDAEIQAYAFLATARHVNPVGTVHGGMIMTFADVAFGSMAWLAIGKRAAVTVQFDMRFVSAVRAGDFVEMAPEVVRATRSLVFLRGTLRAGERVVATADGIWKTVDRA